MSGRSKSDALLRDVAKLFVTYSRKDWEPLLAELGQGSALQKKLAGLIEELATAPPSKSAAKVKKTTRSTKPAPLKWRHPERGPQLLKLSEELRTRKLLPNANALREALIRVGAKMPANAARPAAITSLLLALDELPSEAFRTAAHSIELSGDKGSDSSKGEYQRWFSLIMDDQAKPQSVASLYTNVLDLMDEAVVRGASQFSHKKEQELIAARKKWIAAGGPIIGPALIDEFLRLVTFAKGAAEGEQADLDQKAMDLKARWRSLRRAQSGGVQ